MILGVDVVAFRLAHLLEDDLLGGLRRDAPEHVGRLRELDLHVDFGLFAVQLLGLGERDFRQRILDLLDDLADREQLDLPGVVVELGAQVLGRSVVLARRGKHRVLDGGDDDVGLDALLLRHRLDALLQRIAHHRALERASSVDALTTRPPAARASPAPTECGARVPRSPASRSPHRRVPLRSRAPRHPRSCRTGTAVRRSPPMSRTAPAGPRKRRQSSMCRRGRSSPGDDTSSVYGWSNASSVSSSALTSRLTRWQSSTVTLSPAPLRSAPPACRSGVRSMTTRSTHPIDSRRNSTSKTSSPESRATRAARDRTRATRSCRVITPYNALKHEEVGETPTSSRTSCCVRSETIP